MLGGGAGEIKGGKCSSDGQFYHFVGKKSGSKDGKGKGCWKAGHVNVSLECHLVVS